MNQEKRSGFIVSIVLVLMIIVFIALALHTHIDTSVSMSGGVNTDNTDDGPSKSETRDLAPFTAVESDGAFDIVWTGNQQQSVTVEADKKWLPHIKTESSDGTLKIYTDTSISTSKPMKITLAGAALDRIKLSGSDDFTAKSVHGASLDITAAGSSDIKLDGEVQQVKIDLTGSGSVKADDLKADSVEVTINGAGSADVDAAQSLTATIAGAGSVTYRGHPQNVTKNVAGAGSIESK